MPYLTLKEVSVPNVNGDSETHLVGTVLSDWEVSDFIKTKIKDGSVHYRAIFEPLTDDEALRLRSKQTAVEPDHVVDGNVISPPWEDYVGLHPEEIFKRLKGSRDYDEVQRVKLYEKGGRARTSILEYVAPIERPPFAGYDDLSIREVLEKLDLLSEDGVAEALAYESLHRKRPAILTYEREEVAA